MEAGQSGQSKYSHGITVWIKDRNCQVEPLKSILWRIKNVHSIGDTLAGFPDGVGQLVELQDYSFLNFPPSIIEICGPNSPLTELIQVLRELPSDKRESFFSHLRVISIMSPVSVNDVLYLISLAPLVAFSHNDANFTDSELQIILEELKLIKLRAFDIAEGNVDFILRNLDVEILRFCGSPGIKVDDISVSLSDGEFVSNASVKFVAAQEILFDSVSRPDVSTELPSEAERFLPALERRFPNLKALFWDWNMVDPEFVFDKRTEAILNQLVHLFKKYEMRMLAIVIYSPSGTAANRGRTIAQYLKSRSLPNFLMKTFATKGISSGEPNFVLAVAGSDYPMMLRVEEVVCNARNPTPSLKHLMYVWDRSIETHESNTTIEFCGFDSDLIRRIFHSKSKHSDPGT